MSPIISEGLNLAMYGMVTVFGFLALLVLVMTLMSRLIAALATFIPEEPLLSATPPGGKAPHGTRQAATVAAVHHHRRKVAGSASQARRD